MTVLPMYSHPSMDKSWLPWHPSIDQPVNATREDEKAMKRAGPRSSSRRKRRSMSGMRPSGGGDVRSLIGRDGRCRDFPSNGLVKVFWTRSGNVSRKQNVTIALFRKLLTD